ncbi:hypothetical protein NM208_g8526 [Fusarium decemcellulare]|uniref:Uncharacterized protein n=1 Tax=Fusarium decemcellulare TaxID=57161 RepID=A0ACC1S554_9HYPO|nr:hypothetical protein NM208_g8526 [Fusarium decemcellulare]
MSNTTIGTPVPSPPSSPSPDVAGTNFAWAILGIIAAIFFGIVIVDMIRKYRTGELQETGKNLLTIGGLILMLPFLIFTPRNLKRLWIWFTDLFRSEENKRRGKKKDAITLDKQFDSQAIIQRLGSKGSAKSKSEPAVNVVENNSESSASTSTAKAKEPSEGVLPDVNTGTSSWDTPLPVPTTGITEDIMPGPVEDTVVITEATAEDTAVDITTATVEATTVDTAGDVMEEAVEETKFANNPDYSRLFLSRSSSWLELDIYLSGTRLCISCGMLNGEMDEGKRIMNEVLGAARDAAAEEETTTSSDDIVDVRAEDVKEEDEEEEQTGTVRRRGKGRK